MKDLVERISNDDLQWDGSALGLQPRIRTPETARLAVDRVVSDSQLRELLRDPRRFAIAHVLLTMRAGNLQSFDAEQWNGLHVTLDASGVARYEPSEMEVLARWWDSTGDAR